MTATVPDASVWNFAPEPEPVACPSRYVGHPLAAPGAALVCLINHVETGEVLHGLGFVRWSDEDAAAAEAAVDWRCIDCRMPCSRRQLGGYCSTRCRMADKAEDVREPEEIEA